MKNIFKIITIFTLGLFIVSCEDEDKNPFDVAPLENGAVLRTIAIPNPTIDLFNIAASKFSIEVEFFAGGDTAKNSLLESVDVFVRFRDNTNFNGTNDKEEEPFANIPASAFQVGPSGFPRTTIDVGAQDALTLLGLNPAQIDGGDILSIRLSLNLTNGQVFSSENRSGDVPGPFFNSPFSFDSAFVCNLPTTFLVGDYQATIIEDNNPFGPSIPEGVYTLSATSGTVRTMQVDWGDLGSFIFTLRFQLVCGRTVVPLQNSGGGIGCAPGQVITMATDPGSEGSFNASDDSSFILVFRDFVTDGGCEVTPPTTTIIEFTKL